MEAIGVVLGHKPERLSYDRTTKTIEFESLRVPAPEEPSPDGLLEPFLTPMEMVRQHCEIDTFPAKRYHPLGAAALAAQRIHERGLSLTTIAVRAEEDVQRWLDLDGFKVGTIWKANVLIDPDVPEDTVLFAGGGGPLLRDLEYAVIAYMREEVS